jgi:hypothetical protein
MSGLREIAVGTQKTNLAQRFWGIRVDSILKLDRAAKHGDSDENHEEVPQLGASPFNIPQAVVSRPPARIWYPDEEKAKKQQQSNDS